MRQIFIILLSIFLFTGCEKDNQDRIVFNGIIMRNEWGDYIGVTGNVEDQWNLNDNWSGIERSLFNTNENIVCDSSASPDNIHIKSFPNPCNSTFQVFFTEIEYSHVNLRLVDKNFNILIKNDSVENNRIELSISKCLEFDEKEGCLNVEKLTEGYYRLYYQIVNDDCVFQGHGDILVEN